MEGSKEVTKVNSDLLTNKQLKIQSKIRSFDKLDTAVSDFGSFSYFGSSSDASYLIAFSDNGDFSNFSKSNHFGRKPTHLCHSDERRLVYSPGKRCDVESAVTPESLHEAHKKTDTCNSNEVISENVKVTEKSVTFLELDNQEAEETMKVNPTKNKNQTLRLSKRAFANSSRNTLLHVSEGQSSPRKDVFENEELRLPSRDGERDENRNHSQNKPEGFKDFIVHSSEEDNDTAMVFQDGLLNLGITNLTVDNFELINPEKTEMESISSLHEQCNTVLLFVTHNYTKNKLRRRQAEMLLRKSLETEGLDHRVVPVWVDKDVNKLIPQLAPIKGIQLYQLQKNQVNFKKQVTDLVLTGRKRSIC